MSSSGGGDPGGPPHVPVRDPYELPDDLGGLAELLRRVAEKIDAIAPKPADPQG